MKKRNESPRGAKPSRPSSPDRERKNAPRSDSDRPARGEGPRSRFRDADNERGFKPKRKVTEKLFNKPTLKKSQLEKLAFDSARGKNPFRNERDERSDAPRGPRREDRDFDKRGDARPRGEFRPRREEGDTGRPARRFDRNERSDAPRGPRREDRDSDRPRGEFRPRREEGDTGRPARRFDRDERSDAPRGPRREDRDSDRPRAEFRPRREEGDTGRPARRFNRDERSDAPRGPRREDRDSDRPRAEFRPRREGGDTERPARRSDRDERSPRHAASRPERGGRGSRSAEKETTSEAENRRVGKFSKPPRYDFSDFENKKPRHKKHTDDDVLRLNRYIANAGICSRREADELIESGQITVNGKVVSEMGYKVKRSDVIKYGKKVLNPERMVYLLINKPKDYITTTDDPEERKTVMDLVEGACEERIYPVGRLDRNTTGLLLLTNDGELAEKLTHPSGNIHKIYQAELDKPITTEDFEAMQAGFELEDGFIKPDAIGIVTPDAMVVGLEIHSGKNRIVRRMFEHFGYEVKKLDRTVFAGLNKKDLPRGKWRFLTEKEVIKLKFLI